MARAIHFVTQNVPGYGLADGRFFPCSGVSGRTDSSSPCFSRWPYKALSHFKTAPQKCSSRRISVVCNYGKNQDFSRQNKRGFSQNRNNRQNDEKDGFESLEESDDTLSSKYGTVSSAASNPKLQATSTRVRREEIMQIFRNVQGQIGKKAASKVDNKTTESTQPGGKEDVEPLIRLLKRNLRGKTISSSSGNKRDSILPEPELNGPLEKEKSIPDFILDQSSPNGEFEREESTISLDPDNYVKDETLGYVPESPIFSRPVSKFQRRSPVSQGKYPSILSDVVPSTLINGHSKSIQSNPEIDDPATNALINGRSKSIQSDTEVDDRSMEMEPEPGFSEAIVLDGMLEDEDSDVDEWYSADEVEEEKPTLAVDLNAMKLPELRALAKSRGLKRFSKCKKSELVELLSEGDST